MRIMSFNIQHCNYFPERKILFEPFAAEILSLDADIIGLNEVRGKGPLKGYTDQTEMLSRLTGLHSCFGKAINVGGTSPYGNALLSKYPIISAETVKIPDPEKKTGNAMYESRCIIKAIIDKGEKYTVLVTHMGLNKDERENAVRTLLEIAPDRNCIIMGDFNCTPEAAELKPLYEKYECACDEGFTFPSDAPEKRIDYIFSSRDLIKTEAYISGNIVSDHRSIYTDFEEK